MFDPGKTDLNLPSGPGGRPSPRQGFYARRLAHAAAALGRFGFEAGTRAFKAARDFAFSLSGQLLILIDPDRGATRPFAERCETLVKRMVEAGQERQPGDRRYRQRARAEREGIALDASELARLRALADR